MAAQDGVCDTLPSAAFMWRSDNKTYADPKAKNKSRLWQRAYAACMYRAIVDSDMGYTRIHEKRPSVWTAFSGKLSDGAGHFTGPQAPGAGVDITGGTLHNCFYPFHIGLPTPVGAAMRMRNLNAEHDTFTTAITLCHMLHLLFSSRLNSISDCAAKIKLFFQIIPVYPRGAVKCVREDRLRRKTDYGNSLL